MAAADAWERWLAGIGNPAHALSVAVYGRVTSPTWGFPPRTLNEHMLHFVTGGGHVGTVDGRPVRTAPQSLLWVPPGREQALRCDPARPALAMYYLRFCIGGIEPPPTREFVRDDLGECHALFMSLLSECSARLPGREPAIRACLVLIFSCWRRSLGGGGRRLSDGQREAIRALSECRPDGRPSPVFLARTLGMPYQEFSERFHGTFGMPARTWLMRDRIHRAAHRLSDGGGTVGQVAAEFGYRDHYLFSRQFKAVMGMSPLRWRRRS